VKGTDRPTSLEYIYLSACRPKPILEVPIQDTWGNVRYGAICGDLGGDSGSGDTARLLSDSKLSR